MKKITQFLILFSLVLSSSCKSNVVYNVAVSTYSELGNGVILHEFPVVRPQQDNLEEQILVHPIIPKGWEGITHLKKFKGYEKGKIPNKITVKFQYTKLTDCAFTTSSKAFEIKDNGQKKYLNNSPTYVFKTHCKASQPFGEIHTKTIDLKPYQESQAMNKLGKRNRNGKKYMATIYFEFHDNAAIDVRAESRVSNIW